MRLRLVCTTLLAVPMISALAAAAPQDGVQKTALVTVVAEASGPAANLSAGDFVVREDRLQRDVLAAKAATEPIFITLLLNTIRPQTGVLPPAPTQDLRKALTTFVTIIKTGNPDAQIAILDFAGAPVTAVDFTTEATALDRFIQRLVPNRRADAVLIQAIVESAKMLADKPSPRRAIVAVDFNAPESSSVQSMNQAGETIGKSGATVWTVAVRGTSATSSNREDILNRAARASGGVRLTAVEATGLESMLKSVANSLLSQYHVTFTRPANAVVKSTEMETSKGKKVLLTPWMR